MQEGQNTNESVQTSNANPILASLSSLNTESAPEPQGDSQEPQPTSNESSPQSEGEISNNESENKLNSAEGATELEATEGDNSSEPQGLGNEEGDAAPNTEDKPWYELDSEETVTVEEPESTNVDFSEVSKALGIEGTTKDDVISTITDLKAKTNEYAEKIKSLEETPKYVTPELQQAVEIARNGGDYMGFLGITSMNYDAIPDDQLLAQTEYDGAFKTDEELNSYLNEMDPVQKQIQANKVRKALSDNDAYQKQQLVQQAQEKRLKVDNDIRKTLDGLNDIYGLKITNAMKKQAYDDISMNNYLTSMFQDEQGNPSPQKMIKAYIENKFLKKIVQVNVASARNEGINDVLDEVSNPKVSRRGEAVDAKPKAPESPIQQRMANLKAGKR